jgi:hypothetical protein
MAVAITITAVTPTSATNDLANDGWVRVRAKTIYGPGTPVDFSLDGIVYWPGIADPSDGSYYRDFYTLTSGNYTARARSRSTLFAPYVNASQAFFLGFVTASCTTLAMGTITGTGPTTIGGHDGTITVSGVTAKFPVEYRLDGGAYQSIPFWSGLSSVTHTVFVRYISYPGCVVSGTYVMTDNVTCIAAITQIDVTHESKLFGRDCSISITANYTTSIQYSIDNGATYQTSNYFGFLAPGTYTVKIIDALGCVDSRAVTVYKYKAPYFDWPIVNSSRMVVTSGPVKDNLQQNFDNTLFSNMRFIGAVTERYYEKVINGDNIHYQWRSSYTTQNVKVYKEDNTLVDTIAAVKVKSFMNQSGTSSVQLADAGAGKVQCFFSDILPDFAIIGQTITISGTAYGALNTTFQIKDITSGTLAAAGNVVLLIDCVWPGGAPSLVTGSIAATYDQLPYDVYEIAINWGAYTNGNYYLTVEGSDPQFAALGAQSEPIVLATSFSTATPDTVLVEYSNVENAFKMHYETGIVNQARLEGELRMSDPGGEQTVMEDSERRLIKLNEYVTRIVELVVPWIPSYLAERLTLAFAHDSFKVNGIYYQTQDKPTIERNVDDDLVNLKVKLRQVEFIAENADDNGSIDEPATVLMVNGVLLRLNP